MLATLIDILREKILSKEEVTILFERLGDQSAEERA